jgi:hypothetical protein
MLELYSGVAQVRLPLTWIHPRVALEPKAHWISATIHNSGWMDDCQVCHGSIEAISILDTLDVEEAYSHIASCYHSVQWSVQSHGWRDASFRQDEDCMEGRLVLRCEVSLTEALQILRQSDSNDGHASDISAQPRSFQTIAII